MRTTKCVIRFFKGIMKNLKLFTILVVLLSASIIASLLFGGSKIPLQDMFSALFHPGVAGFNQTIIWGIRIPRIILGLLIGAGLAVSGCVFQGMLRNPLADPYTLGVSGGASLGASIGIILGVERLLGYYGLPLCAFIGAFLSILFIYLLAIKRNFSSTTLILFGVVLSYLFTAVVTFLLSVTTANKAHSTILWLMGDLSSADSGIILPVSIFVIVGIVLIFFFSKDIDLLTLGEEKAYHLGLNVDMTRRILFLLASLITGACVAGSGIIGFVGLMIPHFMRKITGPSHRILLPASAIGGAIFLVLSDTLAKTINYPIELPVGVITGIFGGIFFLIFFLKQKNRKEFF